MSTTSSGKTPASSGLEGVVVANTEMSEVEGQIGRLTVRGYDIEELAGRATFEEVTYLLWHGSLPTTQQLTQFKDELASYRQLPEETVAAIKLAAKRMGPMDALRFAVASLTADDKGHDDESREENIARATMLVARVPIIIANYQRLRNGQQPVEPRGDLGIAGNYLYGLTGELPEESKVRGLDTYLVTVADHGMNASTFTARVIASTASDMVSAVTGAIGALKGPLHGGAPGPALTMIEEIGTPDRAEAWMKDALAKGKRIMGFGHRVYKVRDPRAEVLYQAAVGLADETDERTALELAKAVEEAGVKVLQEAKPGRNLNTNVEFYTALLLRELGLSPDLFSPTFAIGRTAGWTAHILEHRAGGRIIRPQSEYVGPSNLHYTSIAER
ncbi:MAG TPA: citrate synthase/methylcitrate synthase [Thermomicrobiales bacterium]